MESIDLIGFLIGHTFYFNMQAPCLYLKPKACFSEARCGDHFVVSVVLAVDPRTPGGGLFPTSLWWRAWRCRGYCGLDYLGHGSKMLEIRGWHFLEGIWGSGGFRRVRSGVRIRKLLTRASGTLPASRLGRNKIWDFGR